MLQILPGSSRRWLALPLEEQLAHAPGDPCLDDPGGSRNSSPVQSRGQRRWGSWRCAHELAEDTDVEHIVQSSSRGQLEADSHLVDQRQDLTRPDIARLELPLGRVGKGRRSTLPEAQSPTWKDTGRWCRS